MTRLDPEQEKRRLAEVYGSMSDEELQSASRDSGSLTEEARQVLRQEFDRRGLTPEGDLKGAELAFDVAEFDELIILRRYRDLPEAIVAKGFLDAAGIECFLVDEYLVRIDWFWSNLIGGAKLCVREKDEEAALDALGQSLSAQLEVEGVGTFTQPSCPKCQSLDVSFETVNKSVGLTSAWIAGIPLPLRRRRWKCNACGHTWRSQEDDETESDAGP